MKSPAQKLSEVRLLKADDTALARDLLLLFSAAFDEPETYSISQPTDAYLATNLSNRSFLLVVATIDSKVVGGFGGYELQKFEQERSEIFIYDLAVHADYRRQGIATALIEKAKEIAIHRSAYLVWIQSESDDLPASSTYEQFADALKANHYEFDPQSKRRDA